MSVYRMLEKTKRGSVEVNIYDINHERSSSNVEVGKTLLTIKMNLQNKEQLKTIVKMLKDHGLSCEVVS